jgi:hypothetical protein
MSVHIHCIHAEPETSDEISIGHTYEHGESVPQDYATALHWKIARPLPAGRFTPSKN